MLYICASFDYELFMGKNYVPEKKVLIEPTYQLSRMLEKEAVSGCFFADVCCPIQYRKLGYSEFPDQFDTQLRDLISSGHDVQLHIHPNWLKTIKIGNEIEFERKYFRIHNWKTVSENSIKNIIHEGVKYLYNVIKPVYPDYRCIAYRSGGYCLQPENLLTDILYDEGIRIDSSVCPGMSYSQDGMYYDFKKILLNNYFFNVDHGINDNIQHKLSNGLFEVPVGSYKTFPYRLIASKLNKTMSTDKERGTGMALSKRPIEKCTIIQKIYKIIHTSNMVTFDFYSAESISFMIDRIFKENNCKKNNLFISIISHPKSLSDNHIKNMQTAIQQIKKNKNICFVNMKDIAEICNL